MTMIPRTKNLILGLLGWLACSLPTAAVDAFSEGGHRVVAVLAYERLAPAEQAEVDRLLAAHPRFARDFRVPSSIAQDADAVARWHIGTAGYWPDIVRRTPDDRPTWHYELGAALVLGDRGAMDVPEFPGPKPDDANAETQELHIAQAIDLNRAILGDSSRSDAERAVALCWLAHLAGDSHQPCHAGSLYTPRAFPEGDRGANSLRLAIDTNLHAFWDGLLGQRTSPGDVARRVREIQSDAALVLAAEQGLRHPGGRSPSLWLEESRAASVRYVYVPEVLQAVMLVERGLAESVPPIDLPETTRQQSGRVAQLRAAQAGFRLAAVISEALAKASSTPERASDPSEPKPPSGSDAASRGEVSPE